ncbi:GTPase activating protein [Phlyctema vagabunda]|uniref:GTPase activating protein n=1 Tax=Phlyctema vagabunda TaxID=108571 RepID=A0ABR4PCA6_9HELO
MSMANGHNDMEGNAQAYDRSLESQHVSRQRSMKFSLYPARPRTASREGRAGSPSPIRPIGSSHAHPQYQPRASPPREDYAFNQSNTPEPRPATSHHPTSDYRQYPPVTSSPRSVQQRPSDASRLRALNSGHSNNSDGRLTPDRSRTPENFSRPRAPSLKRLAEPPKPLQSANTFPLQAHDEEHTPTQWSTDNARDRGLSISSSQSNTGYPAVQLRPSASIPDYHAPDSIYSRQRNLNNPNNNRLPRTYTRPDSHYSAHRREPVAWPSGDESEEVRASFRSALTTNSSYMGTSGTERSSMMTRSSSATSLYGRDEGLSVDDAIGMYSGGFQDSDVEDVYGTRPHSAISEIGPRSRQEGEISSTLEEEKLPQANREMRLRPNGETRSASRGELRSQPISEIALQPGGEARSVPEDSLYDTLPPPVLRPLVRDSASIFRMGAETPTAENKIPAQVDGNVESQGSYFPRRPSTRPSTKANVLKSDPNRDRYGFRKKTQYITLEQYDEWDGPYTEYLARRRKKWVALLKENNLPTTNPMRFPAKTAKIKRFVRKGIPPDWRGEAWFYYAGGPAMVAKHYGVYDDLVAKAAAGRVTETDNEIIERDLNRTFPDNVKFKPDPPEGEEQTYRASVQPETPILKSLRRVLQAFSIFNPRIGYCQSLNFLAGLLLLFMDEEKSFWMLNIITRVYLPGTHEVNLEGANVDLGVLMTSIKESMPAIWAKIGGELDGTAGDGKVSMRLPPITLCCTAWFMSCFIGTLPIETTLRVWDSFFLEGSKTLFRIALAVFKVGETEIRAVSDPMEIFQVVQTIPRRLIDANALMEVCFFKRRNGFGHLSQATIEARRAERRAGYAEERAIANGEIAVARKGTLFARKRTKAAEQ